MTALGLIGRPWDQRRAVREAVLLGIALAHIFLLFGLHWVLFRYVLPLMTVTLRWISKGIDEVARWGVGTVRRALPLRQPQPQWIDLGILEEHRLIAPYFEQWLDDGIPDRAATLIYQASGVVIYEWRAPDSLRLGAAATPP